MAGPCNQTTRDQARQLVLDGKARGLSGDAIFYKLDQWARSQPDQKAATHAATVQFADKILAEGIVPVSQEIRTKVGDALNTEASKVSGEKAKWLAGLCERVNTAPTPGMTQGITTQNASIDQGIPRATETKASEITSSTLTRSEAEAPIQAIAESQLNEMTAGGGGRYNPISIGGKSGILKSMLAADTATKAEEYVWARTREGSEAGEKWAGGQDEPMRPRGMHLEAASSAIQDDIHDDNRTGYRQDKRSRGADLEEPIDASIGRPRTKTNDARLSEDGEFISNRHDQIGHSSEIQDNPPSQSIQLRSEQRGIEREIGAERVMYPHATSSLASHSIGSQEKSAAETTTVRFARQLRISGTDKKKAQVVAKENHKQENPLRRMTRAVQEKERETKTEKRKTEPFVTAVISKLTKKKEDESSKQRKKEIADSQASKKSEKKAERTDEQNKKTKTSSKKPNPERGTVSEQNKNEKTEKKKHGRAIGQHAIVRAIIGMFRSDTKKGTRKGRNGSSKGKKNQEGRPRGARDNQKRSG